MSWSDHFAWARLSRAGLVLIAAASLGGCLRPLYGPSASGADMRAELAAIDVAMVPERIGHTLRSELIFMLDGSGEPSPKKYTLEIKPTITQTSAVVDSVAARADAATLFGSAAYTLRAHGTGRVITSGSATGSTTYDRTAQRFGNVRAARDAEMRLGKVLAEQIRNRIAAAMSAQ